MQNSGTLILTINEARLIRDTDFFTKMDPYVRINIGGNIQRTSVKNEAGKHPKWFEVSLDLSD